ncbi:MAG: hypothetical protein ACK4GT_09120 [Pararhodobacter sp.]
MIRHTAPRPAFDIYDDLMAISRIEASITLSDRRRAPEVKDFSRLARAIPGLKL